MKILIVHNKYKIAGGEDIQTEEEITLLSKNGIDVHYFCITNDSIDGSNKLKLFFNTIWSRKYYRELLEKIKTEKYDIVHVQNFFPLISPSVFYAAKKAGAKTIMTAHNYRLVCPNALMFVEDKICNACVGKSVPYPALFKKCYRGNLGATATTVAMLTYHNFMNTWGNKIDGIICVSEFVKHQLVLGGFNEKQLYVKFNFVRSSELPVFEQGDYYLYVGRISIEKGIQYLLDSFKKNKKKLIIIGNGPLNYLVDKYVKDTTNIQFLGKLSLDETYTKITKAKALVFPTKSYEPFGRTIIEAFAHGTPVIASSLGGVNELINEGINGFLFNPYEESGLNNAINKFENVDDIESLRKASFHTYQNKFTSESNFNKMIEIYTMILNSN
jgi:glycosyltransferase involved in cell wall biosynthesis